MRLRWDFRTGLYYYLLKPSEARELGHCFPADVIEVRLYSGNQIVGIGKWV